jgi:hypothetical protein
MRNCRGGLSFPCVIWFFIGPPIARILYYVVSRPIDLAAETRMAQAEAAELERAAAEHRLP